MHVDKDAWHLHKNYCQDDSVKRSISLLTATLLLSSASLAHAAGDPAAGQAKAAVCAACHGVDGISLIPMYPNLKGQQATYLIKQMKDFRSGARNDPVMSAQAKPLSDQDIENLAAYYASLK